MKRVNLTITISKPIEEKLRILIPAGEISKFVCELLCKKLEELEKIIISQYQDHSQDIELDEETKSWFLIGRGISQDVQ